MFVCDNYSELARYGLYHLCALSLLDLRKKISSSSFDIVALLYRTIYYDDLPEHEEEMARRLLDDSDFNYYMSIHF